MPLRIHLSLRIAACLSIAVVLAGCNSSNARARDALNAYQTAAASNDVAGVRNALLQLVQAKDDVSEYWVELGKAQASLGNFNDAYYAFTRAYELDRTNVDVLRAVTELALRSGDLASAKSHADELSIVAPGDPTAKLVTGWIALTQSHFNDALAAADSLLTISPGDPSATVLKGRALLGLSREDEAVELLSKQVQSQPSDSGSLQLLSRIYERRDDWSKLFSTMEKLSALTPEDKTNRLLLIEAGFRSGHAAAARAASLRMLKANAEPALIESVLQLWQNYWDWPQRLLDERSLAASAPTLDQKLVYARFLNRAGSPADGLRLSSPAASLPVNARNAEANAVLGDAWARLGHLELAKSRFDAVLAFDPGNATALAGRAELELRMGHTAAAIIDAQKLVTVLPNSADSRILLARSFMAAGNNAEAESTLWQAFQDIPANQAIYAALRASKQGDTDATAQLQAEFNSQRDEKIGRGLG